MQFHIVGLGVAIKNSKVNSYFSRLALCVGFGAVLAGFQNCSKVKVDFGTDVSSQNAVTGDWSNPCNNSELSNTSVPIKILLVVDTSGSNTGPSGTDINKVMRAGSIEQFYSDYGSKANFDWGLVSFKANSATSHIGAGFGVGSVMPAAISSFRAVVDEDSTPYKAALAKAKSLIVNDSNANAETKYIVVFLSDGMPMDYDKDRNNVITASGLNALKSDVTALINLKPGKITLNTVYYGSSSASASNVMLSMAVQGSGQFLDVNLNPGASSFLINSVVTVPGANCPM